MKILETQNLKTFQKTKNYCKYMKISVPTLILTRSNNYNNKNKNSTLGSILCGVSSSVVNPDLFRIRKPDLFRIRIHATTTFGSKKKFRIQPGLDPTPIILNMLESIKKMPSDK